MLWDEFTHARRWGAANIPALREAYGPLPGWSWLQHLSTVVGAVVVALWVAGWWRRTPARTARPSGTPWWPWAVLAGAVLLAGGAAALDATRLGAAALRGATWGTSAVAVAAIALALAWHARRRVG